MASTAPVETPSGPGRPGVVGVLAAIITAILWLIAYAPGYDVPVTESDGVRKAIGAVAASIASLLLPLRARVHSTLLRVARVPAAIGGVAFAIALIGTGFGPLPGGWGGLGVAVTWGLAMLLLYLGVVVFAAAVAMTVEGARLPAVVLAIAMVLHVKTGLVLGFEPLVRLAVAGGWGALAVVAVLPWVRHRATPPSPG